MKKLLIVVDYQNDFVEGSLGFPKAALLDEPISKKIEEYRKNNDDVLFTFDTHTEQYLSTQEGRDIPVGHCIENTEGWKLYGKTGKLLRQDTPSFLKATYGSLELANYLKDKDYESIELVGLVSNICVISNAVLAKSALPESTIIIDASCTASFDDDANEKALDVMESMHMKIINRK